MNRITELFNKTTDVYDRAALMDELMEWAENNSVDLIDFSDSDTLLNYVREAFGPADVFPRHVLGDWAENNGYEET